MTWPEPGKPSVPGAFAFADMDRVPRMRSHAGFAKIEIERVSGMPGGTLDERRHAGVVGPLQLAIGLSILTSQNAISYSSFHRIAPLGDAGVMPNI